MARRVYEGTYDVYFATTVADISAPTVAEITAATDITDFLTRTGFSPNLTNNNVDSKTLRSTFDGMIPGTYGGAPSIEGFRDDTADTLWDLVVYNTPGYLIAVPFGGGALPAATDACMVWQGAWSQKLPGTPGENTQQTFTADFPAIDLDLDATVAA